MKVKLPKRGFGTGLMSMWNVSEGKSFVGGMIVPVEMTEIDVPGYLRDTDNRVINDCIHAKLLGPHDSDYVPYAVIGNNNYYPSYRYGAYEWFCGDDFAARWWIGISDWHPYVSIAFWRYFNAPNLNPDKSFWYTATTSRYDRGFRYQNNYSSFYITSYSSSEASREALALVKDAAFAACSAWYALKPSSRKTGPNWVEDSSFMDTISSLVHVVVNIWADEIREKGKTRWNELFVFPQYSRDRARLVPGTNLNYAPVPAVGPESFMFGEVERFNGVDLMLLGRSTKFYWLNWLIQHAYLDACNNLPTLSDNSISNILELVSFIYNVVVKHQVDIPNSLSSLWMSYRYSYSTSKADIKDAIDFVHRYMDLGGIQRTIKSYGQARTTVDGSVVTCRCGLSVTPRELGYLEKTWEALYRYGLQPNFYVLWDSLPLSFVVDWFLPIGEVLHAGDAMRHFSKQHYDFRDICYSLSYDVEDAVGNKTHCYSRWAGTVPQGLNAFYWFDGPKASDQTVLKRAIDAACLILG